MERPSVHDIKAQFDLLRMKMAEFFGGMLVLVKSIFQTIYIISFILFLFAFIFLLISVLIKDNYESILRIAEFVIIGSGTLAILTFTYALCMGDRKEHNTIVNSGELLFKSTITFIIGMGLLLGLRYMSNNHATISEYYQTYSRPFVEVFEATSALVNPIIAIVGVLTLASSVYFFTLGIIKLMKVLPANADSHSPSTMDSIKRLWFLISH